MNCPVAVAANVEHSAFLSFEELREIAARDGVDTATTLLYKAVSGSLQHERFIKKVQSLAQETKPSPPPSDVKLVIVPGAFYREDPRSGADGHVVREQAERLGWHTDLIPVSGTGSLEDNAGMICQWLGEHRQSRIVLVSLSKGGPDLKVALQQREAERVFEPVVAWINICGLLSGTPIADWVFSWKMGALLFRLYCRLRGQSLEFIKDLRRAPAAPLDFGLRLPTQIRLISIVGFPLREHLTNSMVRRCHRQLTPYGPNDGGLILADVCALPGLIYPIWGGDHYMRSGADMQKLIGAVLKFVGQELAACPSPHSTRPNR